MLLQLVIRDATHFQTVKFGDNNTSIESDAMTDVEEDDIQDDAKRDADEIDNDDGSGDDGNSGENTTGTLSIFRIEETGRDGVDFASSVDAETSTTSVSTSVDAATDAQTPETTTRASVDAGNCYVIYNVSVLLFS